VVQLEGAPGVDAINSVFRDAAAGDCAGYLACSEEPLVSCDVIGDAHSAIIDSLATIAMPGGLAKVIAWYDNGWGYAARIIETIMAMASMPGREAAR